MRLIDADELKDLRDKYIRGEVQFDDEQDLIDRCLTIPAEPIVNARWILENNRHYCSACEMPALARWPDKYDAEEFLTPRCPECGARMKNGC